MIGEYLSGNFSGLFLFVVSFEVRIVQLYVSAFTLLPQISNGLCRDF